VRRPCLRRPAFNTGEPRTGLKTTTTADATASRLGFAGRRYGWSAGRAPEYHDRFDDYIGWLRPRLEETRRILAPHGSLYLQIDPRESHYCKVLARRHLRTAVFPERGGVGVRLRRQDDTPLARENTT